MIVLIVMMIMGMAYAIAVGFGIEKLRNFVKTEFLEQFFNLILIAVVGSGLAFAGAGVMFIAQIGLAGATSSGLISTQNIPSMTNIAELYGFLCTKYVNDAIGTQLGGLISLLPNEFVLGAVQGVSIDAMPDGLGFSISPFRGLWPVQQILGTELGVYAALAGVEVAMAMLLFVIYFLFPILLYSGVLLRSFPWTRAAGGTLVALFIAFYIIFPAMLGPFATISFANTGSVPARPGQ